VIATMNHQKEYPPILNVREAADLLQIGYRLMLRLMHSGQIPFKRVGSNYRVLYSDIIKYMEADDDGGNDDKQNA
jgi:excisionase family DNA binding protein